MFVSPHPDDVCLSVGGFAATSRPALLVTIFTESNWVDPSWSVNARSSDIPRIRQGEEEAYCAHAGLDYVSLGLPDSGVRHAGGGDLRRPSGHETGLRQSVKSAVEDMVKRSHPEAVFAPMGLGGHADHVVCRKAVQQVCAHLPVAYYEDLPYAQEMPLWRIDISARRLSWTLSPVVAEHGMDVTEKAALMQACYPSQCNDVMVDAIGQHSRRLGARFGSESPHRLVERLWVSGDPDRLMQLLPRDSRLLKRGIA